MTKDIEGKTHSDLIIPLFCMIGPSLPYVLAYSAMTKSPDGRGVIIFGGATTEVHENDCSD